jgi:putative transposase
MRSPEIVADRQTAPAFIRCDNGPELTANALRDWWLSPRRRQLLEPGSPWQNRGASPYGSRMRD